MSTLRKHWILGLMAALMIGALATTLNTADKVGQPFGGFFTSRSYPWLVDAPTPPWWPALNSGLRYDDELLALDGNKYGPDSYLLYAKALEAGKKKRYTHRQSQWRTLQPDDSD